MNINIGACFFSRIMVLFVALEHSTLKHMVIESRSQRLKIGTRKTTSATSNGEKITDGASLISPNKVEVQVNGTFVHVGSASTF